MLVIVVAIATCCSTLLGGLFALRLKDHLHFILGFSAGAVIGVAFFDLLPEALEFGTAAYAASTIVTTVALGFALYLVIDRVALHHGHGDEQLHGNFGASTLSIHSLLDGIGIGLAFKVSPALGIVVAVAVLTHDFSDGINTVTVIIKNGGNRARAFRWLVVDAFAPIVGVIATLFFAIPEAELGLLLALFAGFFYISVQAILCPRATTHIRSLGQRLPHCLVWEHCM